MDLGAPTNILVSGPYLVRNASVEHGTLSLWGDLNTTTAITVLATTAITSINWNGAAIHGLQKTSWGALTGRLAGPRTTWSLPDLTKSTWRYANSLPEIEASFNDSALVSADHTNTTNPFPPYYGGPWVLYGSDYGFHVSILSLVPSQTSNVTLCLSSRVIFFGVERSCITVAFQYHPRLMCQYLEGKTLRLRFG